MTSAGPSRRGNTTVDGQDEHDLDDMMPHSPGSLVGGQQSTETVDRNGPPPPSTTNRRSRNQGHQGPVVVTRTPRPNRRSFCYRFCLWLSRLKWKAIFAWMFIFMVLMTCIGTLLDSGNSPGRETSPAVLANSTGAPTTSYEPNVAEHLDHSHQQHDIQTAGFTVYAATASNVKATDSTLAQEWFRDRQTQTAFSPAPGLYLVPISAPSVHWTLTTRYSSPSDSSATAVEWPKLQEWSRDLSAASKESEADLGARGPGDTSEVVAPQEKSDITSLDHWGVEILYFLHRRSLRNMQIEKDWCMNNTCNQNETRLCINGTKLLNKFETQTCEWCWDNSTNKTIPHLAKLEPHCDEFSERSLRVLLTICGVLLLSMLIIMALLALRKLRHMQKRRVARKLSGSEFSGLSQAGAPTAQKRASNDTAEKSPKRTKLQKKRSQRLNPLDEKKSGNASAQNEKVLMMPRAVPHAIDEEVFSDIHNIGPREVVPR